MHYITFSAAGRAAAVLPISRRKLFCCPLCVILNIAPSKFCNCYITAKDYFLVKPEIVQESKQDSSLCEVFIFSSYISLGTWHTQSLLKPMSLFCYYQGRNARGKGSWWLHCIVFTPSILIGPMSIILLCRAPVQKYVSERKKNHLQMNCTKKTSLA